MKLVILLLMVPSICIAKSGTYINGKFVPWKSTKHEAILNKRFCHEVPTLLVTQQMLDILKKYKEQHGDPDAMAQELNKVMMP